MDDVVKENDPGVALALIEGHAERVGVESGGEDIGCGELLPDVAAADLGRHHLDDDLAPFALGYGGGLFGGADLFPISGVVLGH